jgi:hypothetical protein
MSENNNNAATNENAKPLKLMEAANGVETDGVTLPEIESATSMLKNRKKKPAESIEGVIHAGTKVVLASGSKIGKTWILIALIIAFVTGTRFLKYKTKKGKALLVNLEIRREFMADRIETIQKHGNHADLSDLHVWNLRGVTIDFEQLTEAIIERARKENYSLIILDPIYKAMVGRSENSSSTVGILCNQIDRIIEATGAAVIFAHHYAKGNAANKSQIDRMSGSGVFARDADTIITLTEHQQKDCYVVEMTLRNFAPQPPFVVEWQFPMMVERPDLSPADLKTDEATVDDDAEPLVDLLDESPLTTTEWCKAAMEIGYSRAQFFRVMKVLVEKDRVKSNEDKFWSRALVGTGETPATK